MAALEIYRQNHPDSMTLHLFPPSSEMSALRAGSCRRRQKRLQTIWIGRKLKLGGVRSFSGWLSGQDQEEKAILQYITRIVGLFGISLLRWHLHLEHGKNRNAIQYNTEIIHG